MREIKNMYILEYSIVGRGFFLLFFNRFFTFYSWITFLTSNDTSEFCFDGDLNLISYSKRQKTANGLVFPNHIIIY